jgi:hypothetical protein
MTRDDRYDYYNEMFEKGSVPYAKQRRDRRAKRLQREGWYVIYLNPPGGREFGIKAKRLKV